MDVQFSIGCGDSLYVNIPDRHLLGLLTPQEGGSLLISFKEALNQSVVQAIERIPRNMLTKRTTRICIVIPDKTRICPVQEALELVLQTLYKVRKTYRGISIIIATGTHRPLSKQEIVKLVGNKICSRVPIMNHMWKDRDSLANLGEHTIGSYDIPIYVNRVVYESDIVIGIGTVRPHRAVGWSGGAKIVMPGVAGKPTIDAWHWAGWDFPREQIYGEAVNPMRLVVEEIAAKVGLNSVVNFVMDACNWPSAVFGGDYVEVHRLAVQFAEQIFTVQVEEKSNVVIAGANPAASTLWESVEAIQIACDIIEEGGTIILIAQCCNGIAPGFPEVLRYGYLPPPEIRSMVASGRFKDVVAAGHIMYVSEVIHSAKAECVLVSQGINKEEIEKLGLTYAGSPKKALKYVLSKYGPRCRIWTLPMYAAGGLVVRVRGLDN